MPATTMAPSQPTPGLVRPGPRSASASTRPPRPRRAAHAWPKLDVALCATLAVVAAVAATSLPYGNLRLALVLPMLLFLPGYLLLQAFAVPAATGAARGWQALASLGISPTVLGLLALATSIVDGGFRLGAIVFLATLGCLAFAVTALVRRRALARSPTAKPAEAPKSAAVKTGPVRP